MSSSTQSQRALVERLRQVLDEDERVESAWLSGSYGRGIGDVWSDIDIVAVVDEDDRPHCVGEYGGRRNPVGDTVLLGTLHGRIVTAVRPDLERYDIHFVTPQEFRAFDKSDLRPLNVENLDTPPAPPRSPKPYQPSADALVAAASEFLRILGLFPVCLGREEWLVVQEGMFLQRKALIELMIEANGIGRADRGGAKRLNPYLTLEQKAALEAIPQTGAVRAELIAANRAIARLYLPLAKATIAKAGGVWPQALESATRARLESTLGLTF